MQKTSLHRDYMFLKHFRKTKNHRLFSFLVVPFRRFFLGLVEGDVLLPLNLDK